MSDSEGWSEFDSSDEKWEDATDFLPMDFVAPPRRESKKTIAVPGPSAATTPAEALVPAGDRERERKERRAQRKITVERLKERTAAVPNPADQPPPRYDSMPLPPVPGATPAPAAAPVAAPSAAPAAGKPVEDVPPADKVLRAYYDEAASALEMMKELSRGDDPLALNFGWELVREDKDIKVFSKKSEEKLLIGRTEIVLNVPINRMMKILWDESFRVTYQKWLKKEFDIMNNLLQADTIDTLSKRVEVAYRAYDSPIRMVSKRDSVVTKRYAKLDDGSLIFATRSVEHHRYPAVKGFIRIDIKLSGSKLIPLPDGQTKLIYINWSDPKGWVPSSAVNWGISKAVEAVERIRMAMESPKVVELFPVGAPEPVYD